MYFTVFWLHTMYFAAFRLHMMYFGHFGCGGAWDIASAGVHVELNDAFKKLLIDRWGSPWVASRE